MTYLAVLFANQFNNRIGMGFQKSFEAEHDLSPLVYRCIAPGRIRRLRAADRCFYGSVGGEQYLFDSLAR